MRCLDGVFKDVAGVWVSWLKGFRTKFPAVVGPFSRWEFGRSSVQIVFSTKIAF